MCSMYSPKSKTRYWYKIFSLCRGSSYWTDNGGSLSFRHGPRMNLSLTINQHHQDDHAGHIASNETRRQDCHRRCPADMAHGPHQPTRHYLNEILLRTTWGEPPSFPQTAGGHITILSDTEARLLRHERPGRRRMAPLSLSVTYDKQPIDTLFSSCRDTEAGIICMGCFHHSRPCGGTIQIYIQTLSAACATTRRGATNMSGSHHGHTIYRP